MITAKAFAGKHYAVYGLARSGLATVEALLASGARVTAWDAKEEARDKLLPGTGRGTATRSGVVEGAHVSAGSTVGPLHRPAAPAGPPPRSGEEFFARFFLRVPRRDLRPACKQRLDRREARARKPVHRIMLAGEGLGGDHLSFSVARPASASTKLMIQNRITTVGSDQPKCSKWWWIGAIRKTRLPVRL